MERDTTPAGERVGVAPDDAAVEDALRRRLAGVRPGATICPSEVARELAADWRPLMEPTRAAARRLVIRGEAEILQHGAVVDPESARGPIRIRPRDA
jgi:uncharacterized protein DUF3253